MPKAFFAGLCPAPYRGSRPGPWLRLRPRPQLGLAPQTPYPVTIIHAWSTGAVAAPGVGSSALYRASCRFGPASTSLLLLPACSVSVSSLTAHSSSPTPECSSRGTADTVHLSQSSRLRSCRLRQRAEWLPGGKGAPVQPPAHGASGCAGRHHQMLGGMALVLVLRLRHAPSPCAA